jgi:hypothetical protein
MNISKRTAHLILLALDVAILFVLWRGLSEINEIFVDIANSVDVLTFSNRIGLFLVGIGLPMVHSLAIWELFRPDLLVKKARIINTSIAIFGIVLIAAAIFVSLYMQWYTERAGYHYCRGGDRGGMIFKTLTYTMDAEICRRFIIGDIGTPKP